MLYLFYMVSTKRNAVARQRENTPPLQFPVVVSQFPSVGSQVYVAADKAPGTKGAPAHIATDAAMPTILMS